MPALELRRRVNSHTYAIVVLALAALPLACDEEPLEPRSGLVVPIEIVASPDRDTLRFWDSLTLTVRADSGLIPCSIRWTVIPRDVEAVGDSFIYQPQGPGTELVRALARFDGDTVGVAERGFVTRPNSAPLVSITPLTIADSLKRRPIGDTLRLAAEYSDPEGDTILDADVLWFREVADTLEPLGAGPTLLYVLASPSRYRVAVRVSDPGSAHAIARYWTEAYDPLTPSLWRVNVGIQAFGISASPEGVLFLHNGQRRDNPPGVGSCRLVAVSGDGVILWKSDMPDAAAPPVVAPSGDFYLSRLVPGDVLSGELVKYSPAGQEQWVLGADEQGFAATIAPALLHDASLALPTRDNDLHRAVRRVTASGNVLWMTVVPNIPQSYGIGAVAVGVDSTIYVAARGEQYEAHLTAIAPDGTIRWQRAWQEETASPSVLVASERTVLFIADSLYAVSADGTPLWSAGARWGWAVVGTGGVVYYASGSDLLAVDLSDGSEVWRLSIAPESYSYSPLLTSDGQLIVASGMQAISYSASSGEELWRHEFARSVSASPLLTESGLLVFGDGYGSWKRSTSGSGRWIRPGRWPGRRRSGPVG